MSRLPDPLAQGEAVHVRQHHVQDGQVQVLAPDAVQGVGAVVEFMDGVALVFQIDLHQVRDGGLVVHHQNVCAHGLCLSSSLCPGGAGRAPHSRRPLMSLIRDRMMLQSHRTTPGRGSMTSRISRSISSPEAATAWTWSLSRPVTR